MVYEGAVASRTPFDGNEKQVVTLDWGKGVVVEGRVG